MSRTIMKPLARYRIGLRNVPCCGPRAYFARYNSTGWTTTDGNALKDGCLFIDSIFPVHFGRFDLRRYIGLFREKYLLQSVREHISSVHGHGFQSTSVEAYQKDGGVYVRFKYVGEPDALQSIENEVNESITTSGGLPSWVGPSLGRAWVIKGIPWKEDLERFPSNLVKVSFEGPDVNEQILYNVFRPYGQIEDITEPTPVPAGSLRASIIKFKKTRSATIAHNAIHGLQVPPTLSTTGTLTRLRTSYESPIQAHIIRDWISNHPKIFFPALFFLLATLTYAIFDPIRVLMVQGKVEDWFDFREFGIYKWLRVNAIDFIYAHRSENAEVDAWKQTEEAKDSINAYLSDLPTTVAFIHGPQGSGKTKMLNAILKDTKRKYLVIDCRKLLTITTDSGLVAELAQQTGYWPVFAFLSSVNNLVDLASVGLIGQKTGFSSSVTEQLQDILNVVASGLNRVSSSSKERIRRKLAKEQKHLGKEKAMTIPPASTTVQNDEPKVQSEPSITDTFRSLIGLGSQTDSQVPSAPKEVELSVPSVEKLPVDDKSEFQRKVKSVEDVEAVESLPIVVIRNFAASTRNSREELLLNVLATWAANLAENKLAHVIVISDNRENSKRIAKALPTKPLYSVALYDADPAAALSIIQQKLRDANINATFNARQTEYIERLGGRSSDLESLIHKLRNGMSVEDAVEDIINRGVTELRKKAFGDDSEDAKTLSWKPEQAWTVLKLLSSQAEVPYHDVLLNYPFKGDEMPLRNMEQAELVSIGTFNGRPSTIRPGKPVFRWVFERLVNDPVFRATQEIYFNEKVILLSETIVKSCEDELLKLREISRDSYWFSNTTTTSRGNYLLNKMHTAELKVQSLERTNLELKKVLAKGG